MLKRAIAMLLPAGRTETTLDRNCTVDGTVAGRAVAQFAVESPAIR